MPGEPLKLSLYILRQHIAPFLFSLGIITFIFVIDFLVKLLDAILSKGLDVMVILEIFVLNMAWMLALSVPMSCLVASLLAYGRLASDNEITALRASGISPLRIISPAFFMAVLICVGLIYFNNRVLPEANHRAAALRNDVARKKAPAFINPKTLIKDFPNYRLWVDSIDYSKDRLFGVKIYFWERRQPPRYMFASEASMTYSPDGKKILISLFNGENHIVDDKDPARYLRLRFKHQTVAIDNVDDSMHRRERYSRSDREMSVEQMYEVVEDARKRQEKYREEYPAKIFREMEIMDSLLTADSATHVPERLKEKPWWKLYPVSSVYYRRLKNAEKERKYLVTRFEKRMISDEKHASKYLVEIHKKFSIPFACIIFILVGGPLGLTAKKGGFLGVILGCVFFLIYWVCLLRGEALADKFIISPWLAMWSPNIIVGAIGIYFLIRILKVGK